MTPSGQKQSFSLQMPDGRVETFGSRLEADAAFVREKRQRLSSRV